MGLKTPGPNQKGLKKLPKPVRNRMGYAKNGRSRYQEGNRIKQQSFGEAFAAARKELGPGKTFTWNGKSYSTNRADDPKPVAEMKGKSATTVSRPSSPSRQLAGAPKKTTPKATSASGSGMGSKASEDAKLKNLGTPEKAPAKKSRPERRAERLEGRADKIRNRAANRADKKENKATEKSAKKAPASKSKIVEEPKEITFGDASGKPTRQRAQMGTPMTKQEKYAAAEKESEALRTARGAMNPEYKGRAISADTKDAAERKELAARQAYQKTYRDYVSSKGAPTGEEVVQAAKKAGQMKGGGRRRAQLGLLGAGGVNAMKGAQNAEGGFMQKMAGAAKGALAGSPLGRIVGAVQGAKDGGGLQGAFQGFKQGAQFGNGAQQDPNAQAAPAQQKRGGKGRKMKDRRRASYGTRRKASNGMGIESTASGKLMAKTLGVTKNKKR